MTDLLLDDPTALLPWQRSWRRLGRWLEACFGLGRTRRQADAPEPAGPSTTLSHFERWADLYVRHGL